MRVTKQITEITCEIKEYAKPDNVNTTYRKHLIENFPKEERLPSILSNYAVVSRDSNFYKLLVNSQTERYNSGSENYSRDVMLLL